MKVAPENTLQAERSDISSDPDTSTQVKYVVPGKYYPMLNVGKEEIARQQPVACRVECRLLDSKYALQCLLGSVSSSLLRTQIRLAFYSCKWGAFYSCNRGAFYSCNCRNDFLLTYNDKLYLTFGVKNERRHELVLAVLCY